MKHLAWGNGGGKTTAFLQFRDSLHPTGEEGLDSDPLRQAEGGTVGVGLKGLSGHLAAGKTKSSEISNTSSRVACFLHHAGCQGILAGFAFCVPDAMCWAHTLQR